MNFKEFESDQKLRGGYYTPDDLASFLTKWVSLKKPLNILEPSCGEGVFFKWIKQFSSRTSVKAFELDEEEAIKATNCAKLVGLSNVKIEHSDFLGWAINSLVNNNDQFDAIVGNPPFVRYQYLPSLFQGLAEKIFSMLGCKFTKHTNAWVPFVLASMALLKPGGRLAMVVPSEIIHITHAQSLRTYLGQYCKRIAIIDPRELWFPEVLQGAVLLLAEKKLDPSEVGDGLTIYPVNNREFLSSDPENIFNSQKPINGKTVEGKWTKALLSPNTLSLLNDLIEDNTICSFSDVANVDVGIVTGANDYFLVSDEVIKNFNLKKWAHPMFGKSNHCPGIIYDSSQHRANAKDGKPTNFLWFQDEAIEKNQKGRAYIQSGIEQKLHTRYKCRIRHPWYCVPSVYSTKIGMLKRSHDAPRLIMNKMGAYTTDTAYRIQIIKGTAEQMVYSFMNGLTALSAELEGRHYGGGVLELVPSEIERLLIPPPKSGRVKLAKLDQFIRSAPMEEVLERQNKIVLGDIGLSATEQNQLLDEWRKLRNRRQRISPESA